MKFHKIKAEANPNVTDGFCGVPLVIKITTPQCLKRIYFQLESENPESYPKYAALQTSDLYLGNSYCI